MSQQQQQVTPVQIQMAASAGVELLAIKDLPVPMSVAKSGALAVLDGLLQAIARGELLVGPNPELQEKPSDDPAASHVPELAPPGLGRIDGGKAD